MSHKKLVIAEKPSVALDYKKALSQFESFKEHTGFYESENYVISYSVGHLLTIADPKEIDPAFRSWSMNVLPILPQSYPLKPIKNTESQLKLLLKLIQRPDIDTIINGCDAGREGELIFRYILEYAKDKIKNKKQERLWLSSMTQEAILSAFQNIIAGEKMNPLYDAAKSRSEADWVVGINASRALTAYQSLGGGFVLTPCGRVQTPTLMMIVKREAERERFTPSPYYHVDAVFSVGQSEYSGRWFDPSIKEKEGKPTRILKQEKAQEIVKKCQGQQAIISETQKQSSQRPSLLYDLTTLQREANSRFGYSAKMTLSIAQSLYETHKLITYPRTSSKCLPQDYRAVAKETLKALKEDSVLGKYADKALKKDYLNGDHKRIFDNSKISDHFAIIPTPSSRMKKKLTDRQEKIYMMIVQRFIAAFYPAAQFLNTVRISQVKDEFFRTEARILLEAGFKEIYATEKEDVIIDSLKNETKGKVVQIDLESLMTTPPAHYTEATLLSAMEGAGKTIDDEELKEAIKETGIGTPATRAAIIEKLVEDKYVVREDGALISTQKAFRLFDLIEAMNIKQLGSAKLTGEWETKLSKIEHGELSRTQFMKEIETAVKSIVDCVKNFDEKDTEKPDQFEALGKVFHESLSEYYCQDRSIVIKKVIGGRPLSKQEVVELLERGKIGPLEGFRSRRGFSFSAMLVLGQDSKIQFKFDEAVDKEMLKKAPIIGNSPVDGSPVYMLDTQYISQSAIDGQKTGIKMNRIILGKEITLENIVKMLNNEKTDLIQGFRSTKKKRQFDAYLNFDKNGKVEFSFETKTPKAKKKATTASSNSKKATVKTTIKKKATTPSSTSKKVTQAKTKTVKKKKDNS